MPPKGPKSHTAQSKVQPGVETREGDVVFTSARSLRTPESLQPEYLKHRAERKAERDSNLLDLRVDHIKQRLFQVGQVRIERSFCALTIIARITDGTECRSLQHQARATAKIVLLYQGNVGAITFVLSIQLSTQVLVKLHLRKRSSL